MSWSSPLPFNNSFFDGEYDVHVCCVCMLVSYRRFTHCVCFHPPFHPSRTHTVHSYHTHLFVLTVIVHVDACVEVSLTPIIDVGVVIVHAVHVCVAASSVAGDIHTCLRTPSVCSYHDNIHLTLTSLTLEYVSIHYDAECN